MASADISSPTYSPIAPRSTPDAGATLQKNLSRLAARRNALVLWLSIARALSWGLIIAAIPVLAYRFYLVEGAAWIPAIPILLSIAVGIRNGVLARRDAFATALEADEILGLKERLSSAYAFAVPRSTPISSTGLVPSLVEDAANHSQTLKPKKIYPLQFDRTHRVLLTSAAIFAITLFMPNVPWLLAAEDQADRKTIQAQGKKLEIVAKEVKKEEEKKPDTSARRQAQKLGALGQKMQRGRMGKKEALTALGELKKDLEKAAKNDGANQDNAASNQQMQAAMEQIAQQSMESEAGKQIQDKLKKGDAEAAAKEMEKLADKIDKGKMSADEQEKAADDLNKMAKSLKQQGGEQNQKMAQQLEQAAKSLQQQSQQQQKQQGKNGQKNGQEQQGQQAQQGGQKQNQKQGGSSGASGALRQMAKGMRQGNATNSQNLQKMLSKIREAEQGAGSNGSEQGAGSNGSEQFGGQMKPAPGDCTGGDCNGKSMTPGKDLKSSDPHGAVSGGPGLGPRNNATGSKSGGGVSKIKSSRTGDKRRWADVWSDRIPATHKKIDRIQGKYGEEGETEQLPTRTEAKGGPVKTPYYEVYESYKKDAEDAVSKESVPPAYKQSVKDYFESIKP